MARLSAGVRSAGVALKNMQNYGSEWIKYDDVANFLLGGTGTEVNDTSTFLTGSSSIKMSCTTSNDYARVRHLFADPQDVTGKTFTLWYYLHTQTGSGNEDRLSLRVYLGEGYGFDTPDPHYRILYLNDVIYNTQLTVGWNALQFNIADATAFGGVDPTQIKYIYVWLLCENRDMEISIDSMYIDQRSRGKVIFTFDDSRESDYTEAFDYMYTDQEAIRAGSGIKAVSNIISSSVETGTVLTTAQIDIMHAAGWQIGNHTNSGADHSVTPATVAMYEACRDYIKRSRMGRWACGCVS